MISLCPGLFSGDMQAPVRCIFLPIAVQTTDVICLDTVLSCLHLDSRSVLVDFT